ncbi:MAG: lytic transglycosylase domain-containing protein [Clostridium sp.]|nr:lytic transglycosylase domain-containing protein [Clostridium sp.]
MRKTIFTIFAATMTCGAIACATERQAPEPSVPAPERHFSTVAAPAVPLAVEFCGDRIDLDRADMYERLDRELTSMAYTHGTTLLVVKRANRWFPVIAPILKKKGLPADIVYLACIESSLDPTAVSGAKAAGLWQFMPATAREYGLEVNDYVDERYDPVKSTEAACRFLKAAYNRFGNWESVAASYNAGQGRISGELEKQNQESAFDLYLNKETSRYIYRMLAMKTILENPAAFGYTLSADDLYQPYEYREVTVSGPVADWAEWAAKNGTTYLQVREHNPWIRARSLQNKSGKTYTVRIPTEKSMSRTERNKSIYNPNWISE